MLRTRDVWTTARRSALRGADVLRCDRTPAHHSQERDEFVDRPLALRVANVEDLVRPSRSRRCSDRRIRRIADETECAGLSAVALDGEGFFSLQPSDELWDHVVPAHARPIHVVVAEDRVVEAVPAGVVHSKQLTDDLAAAVREARIRHVRDRGSYLLRRRHDERSRVDLRGRCEDEPPDPRQGTSSYDLQRTADVHVKHALGFAIEGPGSLNRSQMQHDVCVGTVLAQSGGVTDIASHDRDVPIERREIVHLPTGRIIQHRYLVARSGKLMGDMRTKEPEAPSHQHLHRYDGRTMLPVRHPEVGILSLGSVPRLPVIFAATLALVVRIAYVVVQTRAQLFDAVFVAGDSVFYLRLARAIASGAGMSLEGGKPTAYVGPGYPLFLVPFVSVGADPLAVGLVQALLGTICVVAGALTAWLLAQRYCPERSTAVLLIAGVLGALYPHLVFWTGYLLTETLFVTLLSVGLLLLVFAWQRGHVGAGAAAGLAFGLAAITRPPALAMLLGLAGWWSVAALRRTRRWAPIALFLIAASVPVLAWGTRNFVDLGAFIVTSSESGEVFFQGNSRSSTGGSRGYVDALDYTPLDLPRNMSETERDRIYFERALADMRADPLRVVARWPSKLGNMWRPTYEGASARNVLITLVSYPPVLVFGLIGALWLARRDLFGAAAVPLMLLLGWMLLHVLVTGMIRFRLAGEHVLIIAAPFGLLAVWSVVRRR